MAVTDNAAVDRSHNKLPLPTLCFVALGLPSHKPEKRSRRIPKRKNSILNS
jgi:hypothetical protein